MTGDRISILTKETDSFLRRSGKRPTCRSRSASAFRTAEHVARFSQICDGVIVGSALVRKIEENLELLKSADNKREGVG